MMRITALSALLLLAACTGGQNPGTECDNCVDTENPDDPNCTDCPVEDGTAEVTYNFRILGDVIDCQLFGNDELLGPTGQKHIVDVGTYTFTAGSEGIRSTDDMPLHPFNGMNWGCERDDAVALMDGDVYEHTCDANVVFAGTLDCTRTAYYYDESSDDYKGDLFDTFNDPPVYTEVLDGYKVSRDSQKGFGIFGDSDYFQVIGDELEIVETSDNDGHYVLRSEITPAGFTATVVTPDWIVADLDCVLQ